MAEGERSISLDESYLYDRILHDISKKHSLVIVDRVTIGKSNATWLVSQGNRGYYINIGTGIHENLSDISGVYQGYMDVNKYIKAKEICEALYGRGVPVPKFTHAGHYQYNNHIFPYAIQEKLEGETLYENWSRYDIDAKMQYIDVSLTTLAHIAENRLSSNFDKANNWYRARFSQMVGIAMKYEVFQLLSINRLADAFEGILRRAAPKDVFGVVHGDYFQKNVLVVGRKVSGVIDWEASMKEGHKGWDYMLSLWWFSGEHDGEKRLFTHGLDHGYYKLLFGGEVDDALLLVELLWYVTAITEFSVMNRFERYTRRLAKIEMIIDCIENEKRYTEYGF